jgi:hypothetical protein
MSTTQNESFAPETEGHSPPRPHAALLDLSGSVDDRATLRMRFCISPLFASPHRRTLRPRREVKNRSRGCTNFFEQVQKNTTSTKSPVEAD